MLEGGGQPSHNYTFLYRYGNAFYHLETGLVIHKGENHISS